MTVRRLVVALAIAVVLTMLAAVLLPALPS